VVIPVELRRRLGFEPGDDLVAWAEEGRLVLERREAVLAGLHGMFSAPAGAVERLIAERRHEASLDDVEAAGGEEKR
jgi:bifunctional DNA-binding transcriptional regulator/antitoxin component of YhaV-PrlF toxin-antitoxin module